MHLIKQSLSFFLCPNSLRVFALLLTLGQVIVDVIQLSHNVFGVQQYASL